jgi:hypothetical protein
LGSSTVIAKTFTRAARASAIAAFNASRPSSVGV